jgi:apolipoprotein D and lipocalin family protein
MKNRKKLVIGSVPVAAGVVLSSFRSRSEIHEEAEPVEDFDVKCNFGTWYEIAQFDHRFGKNIGNTVAQYSLNDNKHVQVRNCEKEGYNTSELVWVKHDKTNPYAA